jgi:hypothetical protein
MSGVNLERYCIKIQCMNCWKIFGVQAPAKLNLGTFGQDEEAA